MDWHVIRTDEETKQFLSSVCALHDSVITGAEYVPSHEAVCRKNTGIIEYVKTGFIVHFNVYSFDRVDKDVPERRGLDVNFKHIKRLNFVPFGADDTGIGTEFSLKKDGAFFFFGELPGPKNKKNEFGFTDERTWLICRETEWRFTDVRGPWW